MPSTGTWWLYVLECQGGVLYTGIAKDVDARFAAHLNGTAAIFTRLNRPLRILAKATMATRGDALRAEYSFKQASRADTLQWCATGLEGFIAGSPLDGTSAYPALASDLSAILSAVRARLVYTHNPMDFSNPSCFA